MRPITARHGQSSAARTAAARRAFARRTGRRATSTSRHKRCEADSCDTVGSEAEDLVRFCSSHKGGGGGVYLARLRCVAPGCEGPRSYGTIAGGVASCGAVHHSSRSRAGRCCACARWRGRGTDRRVRGLVASEELSSFIEHIAYAAACCMLLRLAGPGHLPRDLVLVGRALVSASRARRRRHGRSVGCGQGCVGCPRSVCPSVRITGGRHGGRF